MEEHTNDDLILAYHVRKVALELRDRAAEIACANFEDPKLQLAVQASWKRDSPIELYLPGAMQQLKSISRAVKKIKQESRLEEHRYYSPDA